MMKNRLGVLLLSLLLVNCGNDTKSDMVVGEYTTIEVQELYDAGTVAKGAKITAEFEIKNTGDYPLVIADIRPSCSCTVSEFEEDPIPPGQSTTIKAVVDTDKTGKGVIHKPITITANTKPSTTKVTIKATVTN